MSIKEAEPRIYKAIALADKQIEEFTIELNSRS